jgi:hypothetical protein
VTRHVILLLVCGLGLSACGGGGSSSTTSRTSAASAEQTRLISELRSALEAPGSPVANVHDLDECIVAQAARLPVAGLRKLAASDVSPSATNPLVARCVARGKGLSWVRGIIAGVVAHGLAPPIPGGFSKCVVAGVDKLTPAQLAAALEKSSGGDQTYSRQLGRRLALACVQNPAIFVQWRKLFLDEIRRSLQGHHLPAAFVQCFLGKAEQISATQLIKLVQAGTAAETAYGQKLGRECRSAVRG